MSAVTGFLMIWCMVVAMAFGYHSTVHNLLDPIIRILGVTAVSLVPVDLGLLIWAARKN